MIVLKRMSDEEICMFYRLYGHKKNYISILAQLNATQQLYIKMVLCRNGLYEYSKKEKELIISKIKKYQRERVNVQ